MSKIIGKDLPNIPWQNAPDEETPVWRYRENPIIARNPVQGVPRIFNSSVVPYGDGFIGIFRGDSVTGIPYLYLGRSSDGIRFTFDKTPIRFYTAEGEEYRFEYAYDPRIIPLDGVYYILWCDGYHGAPTLGMGRTADFKRFELMERPLLPYNRNGVLFPKKIDGEYALLSRPSDDGHTPFGDIYLSRSKDLTYWGKHRLVMAHGYEWWQALKIGAGCVPIETDEGWLIFYHGANRTCAGYVYSMGVALLDEKLQLSCRCTDHILTPETDYETVGFVPNVVFPCSVLTDAKTGRIAIYYGSADTYVSLAFTDVERIMKYLKRNGRK